MYFKDTPEGVMQFCESEGQPCHSVQLLLEAAQNFIKHSAVRPDAPSPDAHIHARAALWAAIVGHAR